VRYVQAAGKAVAVAVDEQLVLAAVVAVQQAEISINQVLLAGRVQRRRAAMQVDKHTAAARAARHQQLLTAVEMLGLRDLHQVVVVVAITELIAAKIQAGVIQVVVVVVALFVKP
jgi:hypothetical protein